MRFVISALILALISGAIIMTLSGCGPGEPAQPPVAKIEAKADTLFDDIRVDNYFWLRDRENPEVIAYLEAENAYTEAMTKHTEKFQERLYEEMKSRIQETDMDVPEKIDDYFYYSRSEEGKQYKIYCRKKGGLEAEEEIILDPNVLAGDREFFDLGSYAVSTDHNLMAYTVDTVGYENYTVYFKDLRTGQNLPDIIDKADNKVVWANDNKTIFYTTLGEVNIPDKLWRHRLGDDPKNDRMIYHETDDRFYLYVYKTKSKSHIILGLNSKVTSELRYLDANNPSGEFKIIHPRTRDLEYYAEEHDGNFIIRTNADGAKNFKVMSVSSSNPSISNWRDLIEYRDTIKVENVEVFKDYLVVFERVRGLEQIRVLSYDKKTDYYVNFEEPVYTVWASSNPDYNSGLLRFTYMSFITPRSIYDYSMADKTRELKKQYEVLGGYNPDDFQSERLFAKAADGVEVPISIVYKKGMKKDGSNPFILSGYGAYGLSSDPYFSSNRLSLLDRGFVYGIAHIRGGGEMGEQWYEDGKFLNKMNTFTDYIACAEYVISEGYTSPDKLVAWDGSAGGLTVGAAANMRPELFHAIVADVPFVDVLNSMLDASIPLTVLEYDEWGNPNDEEYYRYMKSYSPYDNVKEQDYPIMLILAGLNDPRVQYWEPAKWTAKLRATKTDDNLLLLKTNMGAGHMGSSGRYDYLKELAFKYTFVLDLFGIKK